MPSFSRNLEETLHRARSLTRTSASTNTPRWSICCSPSATIPMRQTVMKACNVDLAAIKKNLVNYLDTELKSLVVEDTGGEEAKPTAGFQRVIQRAVIHVQSSGRDEVSGANVLVAVFSERESHAAFFLQEQEMTRYDAVNFIAHGIAKKAGASEPRAVKGSDRGRGEAGEDQARRGAGSLLREPQREGQGGQGRPPDRPPRRRLSAPSRCCAAATRTTRSWWATRASARPPSPRAWPARSSTPKCRRCSPAPRCSRSTWARSWPAPAIAATSRSGSSRW